MPLAWDKQQAPNLPAIGKASARQAGHKQIQNLPAIAKAQPGRLVRMIKTCPSGRRVSKLDLRTVLVIENWLLDLICAIGMPLAFFGTCPPSL
jgi:hypothetical protein